VGSKGTQEQKHLADVLKCAKAYVDLCLRGSAVDRVVVGDEAAPLVLATTSAPRTEVVLVRQFHEPRAFRALIHGWCPWAELGPATGFRDPRHFREANLRASGDAFALSTQGRVVEPKAATTTISMGDGGSESSSRRSSEGACGGERHPRSALPSSSVAGGGNRTANSTNSINVQKSDTRGPSPASASSSLSRRLLVSPSEQNLNRLLVETLVAIEDDDDEEEGGGVGDEPSDGGGLETAGGVFGSELERIERDLIETPGSVDHQASLAEPTSAAQESKRASRSTDAPPPPDTSGNTNKKASSAPSLWGMLRRKTIKLKK